MRIVSTVLALCTMSAVVLAQPPRISNALSQVIPEVRMEGTQLREAVDFLRDSSSANFHVNWKALESMGITPETPVSLDVRGVTVRKALDLLLSQNTDGKGLGYYPDRGVIEITTRELADAVMFTKVYSIDDLLIVMPTVDPALALGAVGGNSSRTGTHATASGSSRSGSPRMSTASAGVGRSATGGSGGGGSAGGVQMQREQMGQDLVALIRDIIEPSIWTESGGPASIRHWRGNLIVTAPWRIHERIGG